MKLIAALTLTLLTLTGCAAEPLVMSVYFKPTELYTVEQLDRAAAGAMEEAGYIPVRQVAAGGDYRSRLAAEGDERYTEVAYEPRAQAVWSHAFRGPDGRAVLALDLLVRHDDVTARGIKDTLAATIVAVCPQIDFPVSGWSGLGYDPGQGYGSPLAIHGRSK